MIQSKMLLQYRELVHGFSDRADGDMGVKRLPGEDFDSQVEKGWLRQRDRFFGKLGITSHDVVLARQIHSSIVKCVTARHLGRGAKIEVIFKCADGLVTRTPNIYLTVFTADCMPIFCYAPKQRTVAIIHAGWRGIAKGIISNALEEIRGLKAEMSELIIWIGPHIKVCHYDTDRSQSSFTEKMAAFTPHSGIVVKRDRKRFIDLTALAMRQLIEAGVRTANIEVSVCTACNEDQFYSYHASSGQLNGRMIGVIGYKG